MNRNEAKFILQSYRPGGEDAHDPQFAEALALVERDATLKTWFKQERAFDSEMAAAVQTSSLPPALLDQILQAGKVVQLRPQRYFRVALAAAACFFLLVGVAAAWWNSRPVDFAVLRQHVADEAWGQAQHVQFQSTDLSAIKGWLDKQKLPSNFQIPPGLNSAALYGCNLVEWRGIKVPVLCLHEGVRHLHLVVLEHVEVVDLPRDGWPVYADYGSLRTTSWSRDGTTYVLTGLDSRTFIKRFRQSGRWVWAG